ncbi:MAG: hypothetical protein V3T22_08755 [Planctomycetota bacterium]
MIRPALFWPLLLAAGSLTTVIGAGRVRAAEARLHSAAMRLEQATQKAHELAYLSAKQERVGTRERPRQDVLALLNSVMAEAGVASSSFRSLEVEADVAVRLGTGAETGRYRRQSLSLVLERLSPAQLGAFLEIWQARQGLWIPTRFELTHVRDPRGPQNLYSARILVTATYLDN